MDVPDVILPSVDGEQASVGVIELQHSTDCCHPFSGCVSSASALQINMKKSHRNKG